MTTTVDLSRLAEAAGQPVVWVDYTLAGGAADAVVDVNYPRPS